MKTSLVAVSLLVLFSTARAQQPNDLARWQQQAQRITITRDDWGVPHVKGKTDADAVFGVIYAQAEDDFNRIEMNYLDALGRRAEAEGDEAIWRDLRMKMFVEPKQLQALYASSPAWLKALMNAWADGLNFYLQTHPATKPKVLTRFEPWMALSFTEGSIGGDISGINLRGIEQFYGSRQGAAPPAEEEEVNAVPMGSNGIALAPAVTKNHHALLLINPHTSHYFREEAQMTSGEGLNAYGALTWGQFFIYQGFNATAGWMHTSSAADNVDEYAESVRPRGAGYVYRYGTDERPVTETKINVRYATASGMKTREFTVYRTHHGPVIGESDGKWITVRLMNKPVEALTQSYTRTKARNYKEYRATMQLHANSSNNTIFADAQGNIAYLHANFVPRRDVRFDWSKPVDGSDPATEWGPLHSVEDSPFLLNPSNGWLYNANNWPYSAAGANSPKAADFPRYMDTAGENPRGIHALRVLTDRRDFTPQSLRDAAYDSYMPALADLVPGLVRSYDGLAAGDPLKAALAEPMQLLRAWDYRWGVASVPTTLAVFWAEDMWRAPRNVTGGRSDQYTAIAGASGADQLQALSRVMARLAADFGTWKTPWGDINRFQRFSADITPRFDDAAPSAPVGFTSARWGSLASFDARGSRTTKKLYGTYGNSFVAVVEFGDSVRARAVMAGGLNSVKGSKHFDDQVAPFAAGELREVYFYPNQLKGHTERVYQPGAKP